MPKRSSSSSSSWVPSSESYRSGSSRPNGHPLCFQDALGSYEEEVQKAIDNGEDPATHGLDISNVFFELANAPLVSYRVMIDIPGPHNGLDDDTGSDRQRCVSTTDKDVPSSVCCSSSGLAANEQPSMKGTKDSKIEGSEVTCGKVFGRSKSTEATKTVTPQNEEDDWKVVIQQDVSACGKHTGGIVWETAYLLLNYLLAKSSTRPPTSSSAASFSLPPSIYHGAKILEVGAGCGLVGLGLATAVAAASAAGSVSSASCGTKTHIWLTETSEVMKNLQANLQVNVHNFLSHSSTSKTEQDEMDQNDTSCSSSTPPCIPPPCPQAVTIDWLNYEEDCEKAGIEPHSMDLIFGTDVVFSTSLVRPLLNTLRHLSHDDTQIYLCLQERCKEAHDLLLKCCNNGDRSNSIIGYDEVGKGDEDDFNFCIQDISQSIYESVPSCAWGKELECQILLITVDRRTSRTVDGRRKKDKKKKNRKRKTPTPPILYSKKKGK